MFVVVACTVPIVPVIVWKVSIDPTMASISSIVATEALRMEVFVIDD